jgi:hypothetical protein
MVDFSHGYEAKEILESNFMNGKPVHSSFLVKSEIVIFFLLLLCHKPNLTNVLWKIPELKCMAIDG